MRNIFVAVLLFSAMIGLPVAAANYWYHGIKGQDWPPGMETGKADYQRGIQLKLHSQSQDAISAFQQSISDQKKVNPADSVYVADCYVQIAQLKQRVDPHTGVDEARRAYEIYSKLLPPDDIKLQWPVDLLKNYAATPAEAAPFARQAIEIEKTNGPENTQLIAAKMYDLAQQLANSGRLDEAIDEGKAVIDYCNGNPQIAYQADLMREKIAHWQAQLSGAEPKREVQYQGKFAGRNVQQKAPDNPTPQPAKNIAPEDGQIYYVNGKQVSKSKYEAVKLSNEGADLLQQHQLKPALDKLMQSLDRDADFSQTHANLGLVLSKMGQRDAGIDHLQKAVALAPDDPAPLCMLASAYQSSGDLDKAVETYRQYADKFPGESDISVINALIKDLSDVREKQKSVERNHSASELADNYLPYCTPHGKVRWSCAVKVYIAPTGTLHGYQPSFDEALKQCFADWSSKTNNRVAFKFVPARAQSDIDCFFTNNFAQVSSPSEGGETQQKFDTAGHFSHCTIVLLTEQAASNITPAEGDIRAVALHEIGHAVGLMGHSPKRDDIMYCTAPDDTELKRPELSARDVKTVAKLYEN